MSLIKNHLTIDFEEWYQGLTSTQVRRDKWKLFEKRIQPQTEWLLRVLAENNVQATFFIIGQVARDHPDLIKLIAASGHEIGLHGDTHKPVYAMSRDEFIRDLENNYNAVNAAVPNIRPVGYRAAYASLSDKTKWVWEELARRGFDYDSSVFPIKTPLYGMPRAPRFPYVVQTASKSIVEVPISTVRVVGKNLPFSGGFYFRLLPYQLTRAATNSLNEQSHKVVFYFHPWEFDPGHPQPMCVTRREKMSHYGFLQGTREKFLKLLQEYTFETLESTLHLSPPCCHDCT